MTSIVERVPSRTNLPYPTPICALAPKVYMFGGFSSSRRCSSAVVGSTAFGDKPGGAALDNCIGGSTLRSVVMR